MPIFSTLSMRRLARSSPFPAIRQFGIPTFSWNIEKNCSWRHPGRGPLEESFSEIKGGRIRRLFETLHLQISQITQKEL
jgi:hypothetical protein